MSEAAAKKGPKYLPGDPRGRDQIARMIRVNQAGEYGAKRIYEGQLAVLGKGPSGPTIKHMLEQELEHLDFFNDQINQRRIRPTALTPFWHIAGFALGAASARVSEKAAMAVTVAVEETIDEHYQEQRETLKTNPDEQALSDQIEKFRLEELEHRDIGLDHDAENAPAYPLLSGAVKKGCKMAIWLAERF